MSVSSHVIRIFLHRRGRQRIASVAGPDLFLVM